MAGNEAASLDQLTEDEGLLLLGLARRALERHLRDGALPTDFPDTPALRCRRGVFVTLHLRGELAGCIGYIQSEDPLPDTVIRASIAAGTGDPRFRPVGREELGDLRFEISVLSPLAPVRRPEEIEIGRDGLLIEMAGRRGLLLPQVASSQGWNRWEFLEEVCRKAGLEPDAWKRGATLDRFTAQVFSE